MTIIYVKNFSRRRYSEEFDDSEVKVALRKVYGDDAKYKIKEFEKGLICVQILAWYNKRWERLG